MLGEAGSKIWQCAIAIYLFLPVQTLKKAGESV